VDRIIHQLVPVLARGLRPGPDTSTHPWIIDGTLIPVHDQSITAISKNYRRSVNTQIVICAHRRRVLIVGQCWPGNRNNVVVARHTLAKLLDGRVVLGDGGYRGITSITPRRDTIGRIVRDHHYRQHRRIKSPRRTRPRPTQRLANTAPMPPPRRHAINRNLQNIAGLWNLKTHNQLRRQLDRWLPCANAPWTRART
jgi:hypothetical protein